MPLVVLGPGHPSYICTSYVQHELVAWTVAGQLQVWDLYSGSLLRLLRIAELPITSLQAAEGPSGSPSCLAATSHTDGSCRWTDVHTGDLAQMLPPCTLWEQCPIVRHAHMKGLQTARMVMASGTPHACVARYGQLQVYDLRFVPSTLLPSPPCGPPFPSTLSAPFILYRANVIDDIPAGSHESLGRPASLRKYSYTAWIHMCRTSAVTRMKVPDELCYRAVCTHSIAINR